MIIAGIDVGAATAKCVILVDGLFASSAIMQTGAVVRESARKVTIEALDKAKLSNHNIDYVVSTGYARHMIGFTNKAITEIICHAKGVSYLMPEARTIIDIGGQDSKGISIGNDGTVRTFVMNDKCAAGTGRFLEVMATVLDAGIEEMGPISLTSKKPCEIGSTCTIFAESEIISLRAEGETREDMIAGLHRAVAKRVFVMARPVGFNPGIVFTGGVARNTGVKFFLEEFIKEKIIVPEECQIMGALGAALLAGEDLGVLHGQEQKVYKDYEYFKKQPPAAACKQCQSE